MRSISGPRKHGVVSANLVAAIEGFFGLRDWQGLWLTGGTCLAEYYFGHRRSVDIDLFTSDALLYREARVTLELGDSLGDVGKVETLRVSPYLSQFLLHCRDGETAKIDLVQDVPVALAEKTRCGAVWLDSLLDLTANKMGCLIQREDVKDYIDLFYLIPYLGLTTEKAVELGLNKEAGLDPLVLGAQVQFIASQPRPNFLVDNVLWENVQQFFRSFREDVLRLISP